MQIGRRIRWLERAQAAADRQRIKAQTEMPDVNMQSDDSLGMNLDTRYEVPNSRADYVNIYSFVRTHRGDPAITVCFPSE